MIDSERNYYPVFHTQAQVLQDNPSFAVIMCCSRWLIIRLGGKP